MPAPASFSDHEQVPPRRASPGFRPLRANKKGMRDALPSIMPSFDCPRPDEPHTYGSGSSLTGQIPFPQPDRPPVSQFQPSSGPRSGATAYHATRTPSGLSGR